MSSQKPPTIKELVEQSRTILLSTQANANTAAVNSYDAVAFQLVQFAELSNTQAIEIQRLQELLRKNNIQFTLTVKLPENKIAVTEPELETPPTTHL